LPFAGYENLNGKWGSIFLSKIVTTYKGYMVY